MQRSFHIYVTTTGMRDVLYTSWDDASTAIQVAKNWLYAARLDGYSNATASVHHMGLLTWDGDCWCEPISASAESVVR